MHLDADGAAEAHGKREPPTDIACMLDWGRAATEVFLRLNISSRNLNFLEVVIVPTPVFDLQFCLQHLLA